MNFKSDFRVLNKQGVDRETASALTTTFAKKKCIFKDFLHLLPWFRWLPDCLMQPSSGFKDQTIKFQCKIYFAHG